MDVKTIGIFGLSFSRGFDQTWFNVWRKMGSATISRPSIKMSAAVFER